MPSFGALLFAEFEFLQLTPHDFSRARLRERLHEFDHPRNLVGGHIVPGPVTNVLRLDPPAPLGTQNDERFHCLAAVRLPGPDDTGFGDRRVLIQLRFDLTGPDFKTRRVDHALEPIDNEEITFCVDPPQVAGAEKTLTVELDERLGSVLRFLPIPPKHLRTARDDFAGLAL